MLGSVLAVPWAVFLVNVILHGRLLEFDVIVQSGDGRAFTVLAAVRDWLQGLSIVGEGTPTGGATR